MTVPRNPPRGRLR